MRSKWITHKGERIFFTDLSGLGRHPDAFREELMEAETEARQQPEGSLLVLTDVRDTVLSSEVMDFAKESSARMAKYIRKEAIIGVAGIRQVLLDAVSRFSGQQFAAFDDIEAAKDWLVSES
jgi:replicative superfamily II helicase